MPHRRTSCVLCSAANNHSHRRHREGPRFAIQSSDAAKGQGEGTRCIHATVLRDDRCGSAAGAVSRHSRRAAAERVLKDVLRQVRQNVEEGSTLFAAMEKFPKVFDSLSHRWSSRRNGRCARSDPAASRDPHREGRQLKRSIVSASIYPAAVILVAIGAIALIMIVVIRSFSRSSLVYWTWRVAAAPTRIVMGISNFLAGWGGLATPDNNLGSSAVSLTITRRRRAGG